MGSILMRLRFPTSTRICSKKAPICGKGIYEVDSFEAALEGQIPEMPCSATICWKASFARAGLASDIEVVEEFPSRYEVAAARQHRWVRGDWQLLPWNLRLARHGHNDDSPGRCNPV